MEIKIKMKELQIRNYLKETIFTFRDGEDEVTIRIPIEACDNSLEPLIDNKINKLLKHIRRKSAKKELKKKNELPSFR